MRLHGKELATISSIRVDGEWIGVRGDLAVSTDDVVTWMGWPTASAKVVEYAFLLTEIKGVCCAR